MLKSLINLFKSSDIEVKSKNKQSYDKLLKEIEILNKAKAEYEKLCKRDRDFFYAVENYRITDGPIIQIDPTLPSDSTPSGYTRRWMSIPIYNNEIDLFKEFCEKIKGRRESK